MVEHQDKTLTIGQILLSLLSLLPHYTSNNVLISLSSKAQVQQLALYEYHDYKNYGLKKENENKEEVVCSSC
ncbi:MAG: hypothetical protein NY202_02740 [Mollicutes bacterium UO1]